MAQRVKEHWSKTPAAHDYPAAFDYLSLVLPPAVAEAIVKELRQAGVVHRKAKDLLRASALPVLASDNVHVAKDLDKVERGVKLSPVLLLRGHLPSGQTLTVADGYHRICASYHIDENAEIPCKIADCPPVKAAKPTRTTTKPTKTTKRAAR